MGIELIIRNFFVFLLLENSFLLEEKQSEILLNPIDQMHPPYEQLTTQSKEFNFYQNQSDYMYLSILSTIFCGFIPGLYALVFSIRARQKYEIGQFKESQINANVAKNLNKFAVFTGAAFFIFLFFKNFHSFINRL